MHTFCLTVQKKHAARLLQMSEGLHPKFYVEARSWSSCVGVASSLGKGETLGCWMLGDLQRENVTIYC